MEHIAQTNIQLYEQLRRQGRAIEELLLVHRAYDLVVRVYTGKFQSDGKPIVAHFVGVASIVAELGLPAVAVATACLHNVYGNGDFGDGRDRGVTRFRRDIVRAAVGEEVEAAIIGFRDFRRQQRSRGGLHLIQDIAARDRVFVAIDLADILEKYQDAGVAYYGDHRWVTKHAAEHGEILVGLAERTGYPQLAAGMRQAFFEFEPDPERAMLKFSEVERMQFVMPNSCRWRVSVVVRSKLVALRAILRSVLGRRMGRNNGANLGSLRKDPGV